MLFIVRYFHVNNPDNSVLTSTEFKAINSYDITFIYIVLKILVWTYGTKR